MALRVCSEPGCSELVERGRCAAHRREREQYRGSRQSRGYDRAHELKREWWMPRVASGKVKCSRCHTRISPLEPWHLDHTDDRTGYLGPSHVACNTSAPRSG